ncbi:MAG: PAS domain S-box protein [Bacteroidota bacterium]
MIQEDMEQRRMILAAIIDSSEDAIISKSLDGIIVSWNRSAERMFGYPEAEALGKHISMLIPADRQAEEDMIVANLRAGKRIEHFQTIRVNKAGEEIHISLTISPIRNQAGVVVGASKIARDITEQKRAEEALTRHNRHMEAINVISKAIAGEIDEEKILQRVTDDSTKLVGAAFGAFFYNKTDTKGESYLLFTLSGAPMEAFEKFGMPRNTAVFSKTFKGEGLYRSDDITKDPNYGKNKPYHGMPEGHLPVVSYLAVPVIAPSGGVTGGLFFGHPEKGKFLAEHEGLLQTISSIAAVTLNKAKLYGEVQALNAKKDEFISFASHELKTPLTTIKGYLQLAEKMPDLTTEVMPKINKQVNRLSAIIGDLLDISKIQAGALALNYAPASLHLIIRESIETVKAFSPGHFLEFELPIRDVQIFVDGQKIGQVIINLLANAVKFSKSGSTVLLKSIYYGDFIRVSVHDQGIGIADKEMGKIFSRFYRIEEGKQKTEGLGLGLYISKEIIEAHHGYIWAESELGKGAVFTLEIPVEYKNMPA